MPDKSLKTNSKLLQKASNGHTKSFLLSLINIKIIYFVFFRHSFAPGYFMNDANLDCYNFDQNKFLKLSKQLTKSIETLVQNNLLENRGTNYYNYILLDANLLYKLLNSCDTKSLCTETVLNIFKKCIIYIGKGSNNRRMWHLFEAASILNNEGLYKEISAKFERIIDVWKQGNGIVALQVYNDSDHYVSLCRENAMMEAAGDSITNHNKGSAYGLMEENWTEQDILNFGNFLLYFSLRQCFIEQPIPVYPKDLKKKILKPVYEDKKYFIKTNYEFNGIMECFLEL